MPKPIHLPAFCDCGNVFPSPFSFDGGAVEIENCRVTCPKCRALARVPDGIFEIVGNTLKVLSAPERTVHELNRLAKILADARQSPERAADLEKTIADELPAYAFLQDWIPKTLADRQGYIVIVISLIALILQARNSGKPTQSITPEQVIQQTYVTVQPAPVPKAPARAKVGRNAPCPCGSGKKYKNCCGKAK